MQAAGGEGAPSGEERGEADVEKDAQKATESVPKGGAASEGTPATEDDWGKFYSLPPKWKKEDSPEEAKQSSGDWDKSYSTPPRWEREEPRKQGGLTDENIGHKLASLLRYHLDDENGITSDENGWVVVAQIIDNRDEVGLVGCTAEDLIRVVESNEHSTRGKRFESDGEGRIRATYRHPPKERRGDRWDRDWRDSKARARSRPRGGYNGYSSWRDYNGWDGSRWGYGGWNEDDETWTSWQKPGFSPSPDDTIIKDSTWEDVKADSTKAVASDTGDASKTDNTSSKAEVSPIEASGEQACDWEQWFTPDEESYFWNTKTEEFFFPADIDDTTEKGWVKYVDSEEGGEKGKIYWWHDATGRSFYEDDAVGDVEAAA